MYATMASNDVNICLIPEVKSTPYALYPTPYTIPSPTPYALYPTPYTYIEP
jgi:hypothetical protein